MESSSTPMYTDQIREFYLAYTAVPIYNDCLNEAYFSGYPAIMIIKCLNPFITKQPHDLRGYNHDVELGKTQICFNYFANLCFISKVF